MKVSLIGATGFVGSNILKELLSRGHEVTAISLSADKIDIVDDNLEKVKVDIKDTEKLTDALKGSMMVISAFKPKSDDDSKLYDDYLEGYESIQKAIRAANIRRFFVVGNSGTLFDGGTQLVDSDKFSSKFKSEARASRDYFDKLRLETYLDWVYLSPPTEMSEEVTTGRTGKYRTGRDEPIVKDGSASISVEDLSVAVVDELEHRKFSRQQYTIGY